MTLFTLVKLELEQSLCCVKLHEATEMFMMVDYVREMTVEKPFMMYMDHSSVFSVLFSGEIWNYL